MDLGSQNMSFDVSFPGDAVEALCSSELVDPGLS
jgi:hypothetical protein